METSSERQGAVVPPNSGPCANGYSGASLTYGPSVRKHIELLHMNFLPNGAGAKPRPYMRNGVLTARSQYLFSPSGTPDQNWNLLMQVNAMTVNLATPSALPDGNVSFTATLPPQNQPVFGARPFIGLEGLPLVNLPLLGLMPRYDPTNVNTVVTSGNCSSVQTSHPGPF